MIFILPTKNTNKTITIDYHSFQKGNFDYQKRKNNHLASLRMYVACISYTVKIQTPETDIWGTWGTSKVTSIF